MPLSLRGGQRVGWQLPSSAANTSADAKPCFRSLPQFLLCNVGWILWVVQRTPRFQTSPEHCSWMGITFCCRRWEPAMHDFSSSKCNRRPSSLTVPMWMEQEGRAGLGMLEAEESCPRASGKGESAVRTLWLETPCFS